MRTQRLCFTLFAVTILGACKDDPTGQDPNRLSLEIVTGATPFEEETLAPGASLKLSVRVTKANGDEVAAGAVDWKSDNPAVAAVDAGGLVTAGSGTGSARIIASNGSQADTGVVNVALPVTGEVACTPGEVVRVPGVGELLTLTGPEAVALCLGGGTVAAAEYALIPFNASVAAGSRLDVRVQATGEGTIPEPSNRAVSTARAVPLVQTLERDQSFHASLLERTRDEGRLRRMSGLQPSAPLRIAAPAVGDLLELNVESREKDACAKREPRQGRVAAVTEKAILVADVTNPANGFTDLDYRSIGITFDTLVWRVSTEAFGTPSDVDRNGKVILFYTSAVNALTPPPPNSSSYVGGFFYNRDLFPTTGASACKNSNQAEIFYMMVPDPKGSVNGNARTRDFVLNSTLGVLAHEFQHLINDSRRLYVNKALVWEEGWLNEGLSHIAEELMFYAASGLEPKQNIAADRLTGRAADAFARYGADNVARLVRYMRDPETNTPMGDPDRLQTRGAAWAFLRYAADREPGSDGALWMRLANSTSAGLPNLQAALGVNPRDWMADWSVSTYADDLRLPLAERYQQESWNFRALIPVVEPSAMAGRYPLRTRAPAGVPVALSGGGAAYLRFSVAAGQKAAVRTTVGGLPAPSRLRVMVVRTK